MKPLPVEAEPVLEAVTAMNVRLPGSSEMTSHLSAKKGYELVRVGGILRVTHNGRVRCVPMTNVIDYEPAP